MSGSESPPSGDAVTGRLYFRQLLAGRDLAAADPIARQMVNYVYALGDRATGQALLVDPAYAPGEALEALAADDMVCAGVALTHYHADHAGGAFSSWRIAGVAELLELVDVPVHVQRDEIEWVVKGAGVEAAALVGHDGGDVLEVGGLEVTLLHTPGHTPGSQCLLVSGQVVTGDTLFLTGCGRTDLPGGDATLLYESLTGTLAALPAETIVYPGHAYDPAPDAPLARLRVTNPVLIPQRREEWLARFAG